MSWVSRSCRPRATCFTWRPLSVSVKNRRGSFSGCRLEERGYWLRSFVMVYPYALMTHWHTFKSLRIPRLQDYEPGQLSPEMLRDKQRSTMPRDAWQRKGCVHWGCLAGIQLCAV